VSETGWYVVGANPRYFLIDFDQKNQENNCYFKEKKIKKIIFFSKNVIIIFIAEFNQRALDSATCDFQHFFFEKPLSFSPF